MNVFNRIVMVLILLTLIVAVAFVMMRPVTSASILLGVVHSLRDIVLLMPGSFQVSSAVGVAALVLLLVLLGLEVRPTARRFVQVQTKGRGTANLGLESVANSLEYRIDELEGVRKVVPRLHSRGREVDIVLDVDASPSVNVPSLSEQLISLAHDIVEGQLGLKIHDAVVVNVNYEPYPRGTMPPTQPLGEKGVLRPTMMGPSVDTPPPPEPAPILPRSEVLASPASVTPSEPKAPGREVEPLETRAPREEAVRPEEIVHVESPPPTPYVAPAPDIVDQDEDEESASGLDTL